MYLRRENRYSDIVISMIMRSGESKEEKERALKLFVRNKSYYYDELCDNVYLLLSMRGTNVLTVDAVGNSFINLHNRSSLKKYYDVLIVNELTADCDDIVDLLDAVLDKLEREH